MNTAKTKLTNPVKFKFIQCQKHKIIKMKKLKICMTINLQNYIRGNHYEKPEVTIGEYEIEQNV